MFDLDGTLILSDRSLGGYTVIPGAPEALAALDERGIPYFPVLGAPDLGYEFGS